MGDDTHPEPGRDVSSSRTILVLINQASGTASRADDDLDEQIGRAFAAAGQAAEVRPVSPEELAPTAEAAIGRYRAVVMAGGDGSVSTVANALAGSGTPLGVLPLGTLNHFAGDLGMPTDLDAAVQALANGQIRRIDAGEVNGRLFVNNSSVGIYTDIVEDRDRQCRERGRAKWLAMVIATWRALLHYRRQRLTIGIAGREWRGRTSLLFVGNNSYKLSFPHMGARTRLDGGTLCLFAVLGRGWRLVRLALRALIGTADADREFRRFDDLDEVTISSRQQRLSVAIDGEVTLMETPLRYRSRPAALTVIAPPANAAAQA